MAGWKLIIVGVLILFGFNLLAYGHMKRRIRAAKEEGYRRQREGDAAGGATFLEDDGRLPHKTDLWARDKGSDWGDSSDGGFGDGGGDGGGD